jgi:serine/threonine protein kinase
MSPEQCTGEKVDIRTDIYSMGVVMYEILTGAPPVAGKTAVDVIRKKLDENPLPFKIARPQLSVPSPVEGVVLKCLAKEPRDRFQSMVEVRLALEQAMNGIEVVHLAPDTGLPVIVRELDTAELQEELEKKALSVTKLKAKAKTESFLAVEKDEDAAAVHIDKLKSVEKPGSTPMPNLWPSILGALILAAVAYWYFMAGGKQLLSPTQEHHYAVGVVGGRNANGIFSLHTSSGGSLTLVTDGQTSTSGSLRKGATAKVFYTEKNGKFHADKIIVQR